MSVNLRTRTRGESGKIKESDWSRESQENYSTCFSCVKAVVVSIFSTLKLPRGGASVSRALGFNGQPYWHLFYRPGCYLRFYWKKGLCCWKKSKHRRKTGMCFQALNQSPDHSLPIHTHASRVAEEPMVFTTVIWKTCTTNAHSMPWKKLQSGLPPGTALHPVSS